MPRTKKKPVISTSAAVSPADIPAFTSELEETPVAVAGTAAGKRKPKAKTQAPRKALTARPAAAAASSKRKPFKLPVRRLLLSALVIAVLGLGGYMYWEQHIVTPAEAVSADKQLIAEVAKRVALPQEETPAISTVVDEKKINQDFLRGTKKGDKVLLYFHAGRAIVYRPSTGQVINTGPLDAPSPRVFIRGGAPNADIAKVAAAVSASSAFALDSRDTSALQNTYTKTVVIDLAGNRPDVAAKLANILQATVAPLPPGESRPDADIMVLVGSDYTQP